MATTTTVSNVVREWNGDLQVNEGQLGQTVFDSPAGNIVLTPSTDFDKLYNTYVLSPSADITVTLPAVNTTSTIVSGNAQKGWHCHIKNNSSANTLDIQTFNGNVSIIILGPGAEVMLVAESNAAAITGWVQLIDSTDLQEAYDVSPDGKIIIDSTRGPVKVQDASSATGGNIFEVLDTAGSALLTVDALKTVVDGDLVVNGTTTSIDSEVVNIADNHLYLNKDYTTNVAQTGGLVVNYLPTTTITTSTTGGFASTTTVNVADTTGFSPGQIIQISDAANPDNEGIFEILLVTGVAPGVLTINSTPVNDFTQNTFVVDTTDTTAGVTNVNVSIIRSSIGGDWEVGKGSTGAISFSTLGIGNPTLQVAYDNGNGGTEGLIKINSTDGAVIVEASTANPVESIFTVQSDGGSTNYFDIKNITGAGANPALQALSGNASAARAICIGFNSTATTVDSLSIGTNSDATGNNSVAIGLDANASSTGSIAIGTSIFTSGDNGIGIGNNTTASGSNSCIAIGSGADATTESSIAIGFNSEAITLTNCIAIGAGSTSDGGQSIALGRNSDAGGSLSIAIGAGSNVSTGSAIGIGETTIVSGSNAIGIGAGTTVSGANGAMINTLGAYTHSTANEIKFGASGGFKYITETTANRANELHEQGFVNTTNTTATTIYTLASATNTAYGIYYHVLGLRNTTGSTAGSAGDSWTFDGYCKAKNVAGTLTFLEGDQVAIRDTLGTDVTFNVSTTDLQVQVTGLTNHDIDWIINIYIQDHLLS